MDGLAERDALLRLAYRNRVHQHQQFRAVLNMAGPLDGLSILDVGCGYGDLTPHLPPSAHYLGIDADEHMIDEARTLYPSRHFVCSTTITPADAVLAVASVVIGIVPPAEMIRHMWDATRQVMVLTAWQYGCTPDELKAWLPDQAQITLPDDDVDFYTVVARR